MDHRDEILEVARELRDAAREREDETTETLGEVRNRQTLTIGACRHLFTLVGPSDALMSLLAASIRETTAAEIAFASAIEMREAAEALIAEVES